MENNNSTLVKYPLQIQQKYLTIPICSYSLQCSLLIDTLLYLTAFGGHFDIMISLYALNLEISGKNGIVR